MHISNINDITAHPISIMIVTVLLEYQILGINSSLRTELNPSVIIPHQSVSRQASKHVNLPSKPIPNQP